MSTTVPATTVASTTTTAAPTTTQATTTTAATTTVPPAPAEPAPCAVSYVGDSLGMGTLRNGLPQALAGVGCKLVWNTAYGGMETSVGAQLLAKNTGQPSNVALVMLGYHNAKSEVSQGMFPGLIDQVMKGAGDRIVVWPLLWLHVGLLGRLQAGARPGQPGAARRAGPVAEPAPRRLPDLRRAPPRVLGAPLPAPAASRVPGDGGVAGR